MASETGPQSAHATLAGTTVDTVTLTAPITRVSVINRAIAGGADLWVTYSLTGVAPVDPVAAADDTFWIPPGGFKSFYARSGIIFKILGNGNPYSVEGDELGLP